MTLAELAITIALLGALGLVASRRARGDTLVVIGKVAHVDASGACRRVVHPSSAQRLR